MPCREGSVDPEMRSAKRTTLCRALQSWFVALLYHTEIFNWFRCDQGWSWTLQYGSSPGAGLESPLKRFVPFYYKTQNGHIGHRKIIYRLYIIQYTVPNQTKPILWFLAKPVRIYKQKGHFFNISWPVGSTVPKLLVCPQVMLVIKHTTFGQNLLKRCKAIVSCSLLHKLCQIR